MPSLLSQPAVTDARRRENDRHRPAVVIATLAVLCVYLYLFTPVSGRLGLPTPGMLATGLGMEVSHLFGRDGQVATRLSVENAQQLAGRDEGRLVLLLLIASAFLSTYFLPLQLKQGALALWTLAGVGLLYGSRPAAGLLMAHLAVYLIFHPGNRRDLWLCVLAGLAGYWAFLTGDGTGALQWWPALALPLLVMGAYHYAVLPLLRFPRIAGVLRAVVIHAAILVICLGLVVEVLDDSGITVPIGLLLFFFQWARLTMYQVDYQDGLVPHDISPDRYLAVFLSPGVLPGWTWGMAIPQGYAYVNARFLCEDKNRIVLAGLQLLGIALLYLVFWDWMIHLLVEVFTRNGIEVYDASMRKMARAFSQGHEVTTASVLLTSLLDIIAIVLVVAGVLHFKVGVWRICGYSIEPSFNKPWLATNLMVFWTRFAFHYREFLVRVFYYPVFFRFLKRHPNLRMMLASLAAAALGNLIAHLVMSNLLHDITLQNTGKSLFTWPYFVLLGLGIGVSLIVMRQYKRRRRPWTLDRWFAVDLLAAYVTIQYFALIHIFARPSPDSSLKDLFMLFMRGFGVDLR